LPVRRAANAIYYVMVAGLDEDARRDLDRIVWGKPAEAPRRKSRRPDGDALLDQAFGGVF
jgi:hypothetical protein